MPSLIFQAEAASKSMGDLVSPCHDLHTGQDCCCPRQLDMCIPVSLNTLYSWCLLLYKWPAVFLSIEFPSVDLGEEKFLSQLTIV